MSKARIMYNMTVREVRAGLRETKTVLVPTGVVEQHGYHLPLGTDIIVAQEIARMASEMTGCFVAPAVHYSFSGGMLPGTINISPQTFSLVLMDIFRSLITQGFANIVVVPGHGGTEAVRAIYDAAENFQRLSPGLEGKAIAVFRGVESKVFPEASRRAGGKPDYHAGLSETSLIMHFRPDLAQMERAEQDRADILEMMLSDPDAYLVKTTKIGSRHVVPKAVQHPEIQVGVMGYYQGANAELGRALAEERAKELAELVDQLDYAG
jgi:creatinine amidohydrolase